MRTIVALLLLAAGCGEIDAAPDAPGGPCEARETVAGVGMRSAAVLAAADANKTLVTGDACSKVDMGVGEAETISAHWGDKAVSESSVSVGQSGCYYYWTRTVQLDDCHWSVTTELVTPKTAQ